jgi:LysM repeat protein
MNYFVIAGQGLFVPTGEITDEGPNVYEVQSGDTMNSVAFQCGLTSASLASANGLGLDDSLTPGRMLLIPPWVYR